MVRQLLDSQQQRSLLISGADMLGLRLEAGAAEDLLAYLAELIRWGRKMNLVGRSMSAEQIIENHFLDSLTLLPLLEMDKVVTPHLLDVGSGAGFPGLVCKAVMRDMGLTIVEPRLKRVSFLRHIVRTLRLDAVRIMACRIEDESLADSEMQFSHITGRAVTELSDFLPMVAPFIRPGVQVICMKGPKWRQELDRAEEVMAVMSLGLSKKLHFNLPYSEAERTLLVFETIATKAGNKE